MSGDSHINLLKEKLGDTYYKLAALENEKLNNFLATYIELCNPDTVYMCDDREEDAEYIRKRAIESGEEAPLAKTGQTIHFDGYYDQARDKANTRFMVSKEHLAKMANLNCVEYEEGIKEIRGIARDIMKGKEAIVKIYCEGPPFSQFTIPCVQLTDSFYVAHSENLLYRNGYEHFKQMKDKDDFFAFCHSAGRLDENKNCIDIDKRRIYQDLDNNIVYSMNAQYAGNTVGLKKHSMRLAINKSGKEGWLCEHMFIMSIQNKEKQRSSYFCGAFPSACGKTATAMIPGEKIVGDDIAYFRNINGEFRAVNVEHGIFGIIKDVNPVDDPVIFNALMQEKEMIFSNVLVGEDNNPYWLGMGVPVPEKGRNFAGQWHRGKKDAKGKEIPLAHPNARYTVKLEYLENIDPAFDNPEGVIVDAVIYGGRDSDTTVPVEEARSWKEGIILKAITLESETTSATIGKEGVRVPQPMANLDFISYPLGEYFENNINFVNGMKKSPKIFSVNYFLKKDGEFCTSKLAKKVWMHWAEGRCHNDFDAIETPTGLIPEYEDIKALFKSLLDEDYLKEDYEYQFAFRINAWIEKFERAVEFFSSNHSGIPKYIIETWENLIAHLAELKNQYGEVILPGQYQKNF